MISFQVLIMALLGGARRLCGPLLGAVPLTLLFELLSAHFPNTFTIILGCIFVADRLPAAARRRRDCSRSWRRRRAANRTQRVAA